ncbi:hypothetical protein HY571_00785 [Candidatus Micrarchaeota archaeon]|nr:hypothetical protein [Candidatus Micrarchaeota archaeon]
MDDLLRCKLQINAMRRIIEKYAEQINSFEVKTVPELKGFINKDDPAVKKISEKLKQEFQNKSGKPYSQEFLPKLSLAAFHFVSSLEVIGADLPVSFWFSPSDVLELGAADAFDRAIFLSSLLASLGAGAKIHVLEVEGGLRHPVVISGNHLFDPFPPASFFSKESQEALLTAYRFGGRKYTRSLFEFDSETYREFTQ